MVKPKSIAFDAYQALAENYSRRINTKPHNAYYERPATLSLLPKVKGKRVLDAGCGPGKYAEILTQHGAQVYGIDLSPKMIRLARKRLGKKAMFRVADLNQPLSFIEKASFDIVICPLVMDYIRNLKPMFQEFYRILRSPGILVFSDGHPFNDFLYFQKRGKNVTYLSTELVGCEWHGFGKSVYVPWYRRPISAVLNPLIAVGFRIDRILEPKPTKQFKRALPEDYRELKHAPPVFICIRAIKD
ncbi:MAG: class I SAM-dependent methyltransferase [bacterium]